MLLVKSNRRASHLEEFLSLLMVCRVRVSKRGSHRFTFFCLIYKFAHLPSFAKLYISQFLSYPWILTVNLTKSSKQSLCHSLMLNCIEIPFVKNFEPF